MSCSNAKVTQLTATDEQPILVITRDKPGCLITYMIAFFLFLNIACWSRANELLFIDALLLIFIIDYVDAFWAKVIVFKNVLVYKNWSTVFNYKTLPFKEIKTVRASYNRGFVTLQVIPKKGLLIGLKDVSDAFEIKKKLDSLIFSPDEIKNKAIKSEKANASDLFVFAVFFLILPFILLGILYFFHIF